MTRVSWIYSTIGIHEHESLDLWDGAKFWSYFLDEPVTAREAVDDLGLEPGAEDEGEYEGDRGGHQDHNHPVLKGTVAWDGFLA